MAVLRVDWMAMQCWGKVGCKLQSPATLHTQLGYTAIHFTLENPYSSCIFSLSPSDSGNCNCAFITNPVAERTTYLRSMFARLKGGETFLYRGFAFFDLNCLFEHHHHCICIINSSLSGVTPCRVQSSPKPTMARNEIDPRTEKLEAKQPSRFINPNIKYTIG